MVPRMAVIQLGFLNLDIALQAGDRRTVIRGLKFRKRVRWTGHKADHAPDVTRLYAEMHGAAN